MTERNLNPDDEIAETESDVVSEIGHAIGLTYEDDEPLRAGDKEEERDEHRWELDPASADDYEERAHEPALSGRVRHMRHRDQYKNVDG
jgi:hypothetical protein